MTDAIQQGAARVSSTVRKPLIQVLTEREV